ncbi:Alpha/Beta hydrolase protein [Amylocarpus encephaloides]|uniref:Alpha/Beta hydrolase protein n=1 Tax=Amylocarpus encephaloides TaxID=45428 RepID=A0A9P7YC65_9HELO|nr:Alpha/Beta hydrolase protein [Amylocarpus encephaloides]
MPSPSIVAPRPFQISVSQAKVDTLKKKLSQAEFPDELSASGWDLGVPLSDMKRLTSAYEQWDWRQAEDRLNQVPQYHTPVRVDGFEELDMHFVWQESPVENAIPLLFVHGVGPGSFLEALRILPLLSAPPSGPAFHIVAPSLPNHGFSAGVKTRGFGLKQYGEACHKLMLSLGYDQYVTQGGDWGFYITRAIGRLYPEHCKASHLNMLRAPPPSFTKHPVLALQHTLTPYTAREQEGFRRTAWFAREGQGYFQEQATKPQTLAYALNDSPAALLAWIYEKLHDWSDAYPWSDDEIFTWVSIYAFSTAGPGAAHRIYYEAMHTEGFPREELTEYTPGVKLGLAYNPRELSVLPRTWCRTLGPVVYESFNESGGHFYATENPERLARDLKTMFGEGGGAYGVVKGRNGYDRLKARL